MNASGTGGNGGGQEATVSVRRLEILEAISAAALSALDLQGVARELLTRVTEAFRADTAAVLLLDEETNELVARAAKGLEAEVEAGSRVPVGRGFAGRVAARCEPIVVPDASSFDIYNPILREAGVASLVGVPLVVEDRVIGVLHVGSLVPREFDDDDVELLQLVAERIALAIEHTRLFEAERAARSEAERANARLRRMESLTETALNRVALDDDLLRGLLIRVREMLDADTAAILLLDPDASELVARAAAGLEEEVERGVRIPIGSGFAGRVAAERRPVVLPDVDHAHVLNPLLREKRIRTLAGVPLVADAAVLGVLHVGTLTPRDFTDDDIALLELAAERIALAIAHSRLHEREHEIAAALHRTLLPDRLPEVPGIELAARYLPGDGAEIGGDWYDLIPLARGEIALVMGDVVSRGLRAAASTGQIRNSLRAYALEGDAPARVLERVDRIVRGLGRREMATVVYMLLDPHELTFTLSSAGHPPPLLVAPDGGTAFLEGGRSSPLGAVSDPVFVEASGTIDAGSTLVLYTDGLVERRDLWIDEGMRQLAQAAAAAAAEEAVPDALCDGLLDALRGGPAQDDVAMLAVKPIALAGAKLAFALPAEPASLAVMRRGLRVWLARAGAADEELYDLLVAASEAAANAVEHAYGPIDANFELDAALDDDEVTIIVRDFGQWRPPRGHNRGRGTLLMKELTDAFELSATGRGTEVILTRRLTATARA